MGVEKALLEEVVERMVDGVQWKGMMVQQQKLPEGVEEKTLLQCQALDCHCDPELCPS